MLRILNERNIVMRQKLWWLNFGIGVFIFVVLIYFLVEAQLKYGNFSAFDIGTIIVIAFLLLFFCVIVSCTVKMTVKDRTIVIETLFVLHRSFSIEDIDCIRIVKKESGYTKYKGIEIIVNGKKVRMLREPSELWNNFDELIMYFKEKNILLEREQ